MVKHLVSLALILLALGCIGGTEPLDDGIVCDAPYIRVGGDCCLDANGNRICDEHEKKTTTTAKEMPTTTVAQTTTTVALAQAECSSDGDCPADELLVICSGDDVVKLDIKYSCADAGKATAHCEGSTVATKLDTCDANEECYAGVCVDQDTIDDMESAPTTTVAPTTTLAAESTTTLAGQTTTTVAVTTTLPLACNAAKAWLPSQCAARTCSLLKSCEYVPNINPMLPGGCTCKTIDLAPMTTTTTVAAVPCSGLPAFKASACSSRSCPLGKSCKYHPGSNPWNIGSCSCEGFTPMTVFTTSIPYFTTSTTLVSMPSFTMVIPSSSSTTTPTTSTLGYIPGTFVVVTTTTEPEYMTTTLGGMVTITSPIQIMTTIYVPPMGPQF